MHTHTSVSVHAFSTLAENADAALGRRLYAIAKTDHGPAVGDAPNGWHFGNIMSTVPMFMNGVRIYRGAELNIINYNGDVDLDENTIKHYEWTIASFHDWNLGDNFAGCTEAWLNIAKNKYIDCIGHCGNGRYEFDYEKVIKAFAENEKVVEINNHSFYVRQGSDINCPKIASLCKKYGVRIVVTSDAHSAAQVGIFSRSIPLLEEIDFPNELILNDGNRDKVMELVKQNTAKKLSNY